MIVPYIQDVDEFMYLSFSIIPEFVL